MASPPDRPALVQPPPSETDAQAWFVEYGPGLRAYFRKRVAPGEVEDLVQEVFLAMYNRTDAAPVDQIQRYLFRVAASVLARRLRKHEPLELPLDGHEPVDDVSPERILDGKQDLERFMVAVRNLPPRSRTAFVLHRFEEMTYASVALRMGVTIDAVKALLSRAILKLEDELADL